MRLMADSLELLPSGLQFIEKQTLGFIRQLHVLLVQTSSLIIASNCSISRKACRCGNELFVMSEGGSDYSHSQLDVCSFFFAPSSVQAVVFFMMTVNTRLTFFRNAELLFGSSITHSVAHRDIRKFY